MVTRIIKENTKDIWQLTDWNKKKNSDDYQNAKTNVLEISRWLPLY